jgi:hypothetical protein
MRSRAATVATAASVCLALLTGDLRLAATVDALTSRATRHYTFATTRRPFSPSSTGSSTRLWYDTSRDPPSSPEYNAWQVLANTERWISETLVQSNQAPGTAAAKPAVPNNPYARKEVSYACETQAQPALVVASIFRHLRQAREVGQEHAKSCQDMSSTFKKYEPTTLRQTHVIVIPSVPTFSSFAPFHQVMERINQARRNARDYVRSTSDSPKFMDNWSVSVNCAHLHPSFGERSPAEQIQDLEEIEVDLNYQDYQRKKQMARRSPYPTVVVEVRATPSPEFSKQTGPSIDREKLKELHNWLKKPANSGDADEDDEEDDDEEEGDLDTPVTSADIAKLEALLGKSASVPKEKWSDAIGESLPEIMTRSTQELAEQWIAAHDPVVHAANSITLTESTTSHIDAAYEFVFTNLAMLQDQASNTKTSSDMLLLRQYLVLPQLLPTSATSLEKFALEVQNILSALPDLPVTVGLFHPEHVESSLRAPMPVVTLTWQQAA